LSVVLGLVFDGWDVAEFTVEAGGVEPVDPAEGGQLEIVNGPSRPSPAGQLGLEQ